MAVVVAKNLAGREKEIGEGMAQIYATEFTEQELKDLVAFYKTPLGAEAACQRTARHPAQHDLDAAVGAGILGKDQRRIPQRDEEAQQADLIGDLV